MAYSSANLEGNLFNRHHPKETFALSHSCIDETRADIGDNDFTKRGETDVIPPLYYNRVGDSEIPYNYSGILIFPVLLRLADVSLVAELGHLLSLGEEFLGLVGISLLN